MVNDEEEPIVLNLEQVVIGFKLSVDPDESGNQISKREAPNANINQDLEDSFGGLSHQSTESKQSERKIGFYYLVDWNSFFDIDNQAGTRVNLRIQPKLGNPARFIPVTIP